MNEDEIKLILEKVKTDPDNLVKDFEARKKENVSEFVKEYNGNRDLRDTQLENIQKDKTVGTGANQRVVKKARLKVQHQKKIVRTGTAFEVGEAATLIPNDSKLSLHSEVDAIWKNNRIDAKIQNLVKLKKAHTEAALLFYLNPLTSDNLIGKFLGSLGIGQKFEIKAREISNENASLMPWFDGNVDMIAFGYGFNTKIGDKEVKNVWIYTKENCIKLDNSTGKFIETENKPHGFTKIPIVYVEQDFPEWEDAKELIDRYEVSISKLADSNDYTAHPIMIVEGKVTGAPVKEEVGKVFNIPIDYDDQGKERKGDIRFLKNEQAPEAVKLEFETIVNDIHSITSTPNISFDNVKSIGTVSGIALKLLFLDAIIKAKSNEGENRTMYERIINIIISGVIKTINTKLIKESTELRYDIQFNSILQDDLKTAADVIKTLRDAGVISKKTSIQYLKMVDNVDDEITLIQGEEKTVEPTPTNTI